MARISYVDFNGDEHLVDVPDGISVMEGAVKNGIAGIDGDCGGELVCATCQVYVDPAWLERVGGPSADELAVLEFAEEVRANSRLSCQIQVTEALDGLIVTTPASQR
jgi:2Fe-2S ferredoxin